MASSKTSTHHNLRQFVGIRRLLLLSSSLFFATSASSRLVNITVDDTFGDSITGAIPEYSSSPNTGTWVAGSPSQNATTCGCHINPSIVDVTQIHNGTWHDATPLTSDPSSTITIHFIGSAVYVFTILPNTLSVTITLANISFSIDGEDVGTFVRSPEPGTSILYNQLVYHNTTLNDGPHTLVITPSSYSLILFDYLLYTAQLEDSDTNSSPSSTSFSTFPSTTSTGTNGSPQSPSGTPTSTSTPDGSIPSASSHTPTPVGSVVGPVLGATALLGVVVVAFFLYRRHTRSKLDTHGDDWPGYASFATLSTRSATPTSFPFDGARAHNLPDLTSDSEGSGPFLAGAHDGRGSLPAEGRSASHPSLSELTRRLDALRHTRSILSSSQAPSRHSRSGLSTQ